MPINPLYALFGGKLKEESAVSPEGIPYTQYAPKSRLLDVFLNKGRDTQAARDYNVANRAALYGTAADKFLRQLQDKAAMERMQLGESEAMNRLMYGEAEAGKRQQASFTHAEKLAAAADAAAMNRLTYGEGQAMERLKYGEGQAGSRQEAALRNARELQELQELAATRRLTQSEQGAMDRLMFGEGSQDRRQQAGFTQAEKMAKLEKEYQDLARAAEYQNRLGVLSKQYELERAGIQDERSFAEAQRQAQLRRLGQAALSDPSTRGFLETSFLESPTPEQAGSLISNYSMMTPYNEGRLTADAYAYDPSLRRREIASRAALEPNRIYPKSALKGDDIIVQPPYTSTGFDPATKQLRTIQTPAKPTDLSGRPYVAPIVRDTEVKLPKFEKPRYKPEFKVNSAVQDFRPSMSKRSKPLSVPPQDVRFEDDLIADWLLRQRQAGLPY